MGSVIRAVRARDAWIVLGLIALAVGLPAIVGAISGAISIPHNDDFAYRRPALTLYETGRLELTGWAVMTLVGQLAATMPLLWLAGGSAWAFAATTAIFAVVAIIASYSLARRLLPPGLAALAVLLAVLVPGFMVYTTAYMTEIPTFAMEMSSLAIGAVALHRAPGDGRWRWLAASLVVGCYAFSIREYAFAAPVAVLVAAAASDRQGRRLPYAVALVAVVAVCAAIYALTDELPGQGGVGLNAPTAETTRRVLDAVGLLAFALAPALLIAVARWAPHWWRSRDRLGAVLGALAGAIIAAFFYGERLGVLLGGAPAPSPDFFVGNVFHSHGSLGVGIFAGDRPALYDAPLWQLLNTVAVVATFVLFAFLGAVLVAERHRLVRAVDTRHRPSPLGSVTGLVVVFTVLFAAGTIAVGLTVILFDRYTWPLAFPLAILLLLPPRPDTVGEPADPADPLGGRPQRRGFLAVVTGALVAVTASTSLALMLNAAAFDSARWRMGEEAVHLGFAAETVDAGLEWVGFHASGLARLTAQPQATMTEYAVKFPSFHRCAVASSTPLDVPGFTLLLARTDAYRLLLIAGAAEPMYLYQVAGPGCPPGR
jgi:hypothetical protein